MSEKLYALLLKLYPEHFRQKYGDEALRLVRDRAHAERGILPVLRLWLDLLVDLAMSLPREYSHASTTPVAAVQPLNAEPLFHFLAERPPNPALMIVGGMVSAALFWACVTSVAHSRIFPARFQDPHSLQGLVQNGLALARSSALSAYSFCMTAHRDIPDNSAQPLFTFDFAPPGASGVALIDGKIVKTFSNEPNLSIRAYVPAGDHLFALRLDKPAEYTSMSGNVDFGECPAR